MAEKNLSIRISVKDAEKAKQAFRSLGEDGNKYLKQIDKALQPPNRSLIALRRASGEADDALRRMGGNIGSAGYVLEAFGKKGLIAAAGIGAVTLAITKGLRAYGEEERAQLRLQAQLKLTGDVAGVTASQIDALAERMEKTTFFNKEDILQAAAALTTFKAVSGEAFGTVLKLAGDLAEAGFGDLTTNAKAMGKALKDPVDGLGALKKLAGELPPEVKKVSQELEGMGRHAQAVDVILAEFQSKVGGTAAEAASGFAGQVNHLGKSFGDLVKVIGEITESSLGGWLGDMAKLVDELTGALQRLKAEGAAEKDKLLADAYLSGNIPFPEDAASVQAMREAAMRAYPGLRFDRPKTVDKPTVVEGYYFDSYGNLHPPSEPSKGAREEREKAATKTTEQRLRLLREIGDLEAEHAAFARGGEKEIAIQKQMNSFLAQAKGLRADEVEQLAAKYEQQLRIAQADAESVEQARELEREWKRAAEERARPFEHAYERMQDAAADWLSGEKINAATFVGIWKRAAAEMAAAMIFRPMFSSVFGGLAPGVSGSVTSGGGGAFSGLSGLSSLGSGLFKGFNTPLVNPGLAFDIGSYLGLGGNTVGALHTALGNFTPLSGIAGFGGGMAASLLGLSGKYSGATGTLGGILGTALGGPLGALGGSFLGSALGGLFGGGKKHPGASFAGQFGTAGLESNPIILAKHMGTEQAAGLAGQLSTFLASLASASGATFNRTHIQGILDPQGGMLRVPGKVNYKFNPNSAESTAAAFQKMALFLARTADVVNDDLVKALTNVQTKGRDAGAVLNSLVQTLEFASSLREFSAGLGRDPATSTLSPEELRTTASAFLDEVAGRARAGQAGAGDVQSAALAYLQASQGYAGRASGVYAADLARVQELLAALSAAPPRFAYGGNFRGGVFVTHPGETVMTSTTPGRVFNARETRDMLRGGEAQTLRLMADLKEMFGALLAANRQTNSLLERATA